MVNSTTSEIIESFVRQLITASGIQNSVSLDRAIQEFSSNSNLSKAYLQRSCKPAFKILQNEFRDSMTSELSDKNKMRIFINKIFTEKKYWFAALIFRSLKSFFTFCLDSNYINSNPLFGMKIPKPPQELEIKTISDEHLILILPKIPFEMFRDLILLLRLTGCRPSELLNLRIGDIKADYIAIGSKNFRTKTGRLRLIPKTQIISNIISKHFPKIIDPEAFLFSKPGKNEPYTVDRLSKLFKEASRAAGFPDYQLYDLRHTFATDLLNRGLPMEQIAKLLGHSSVRITENHYAKMRIETLSASLNSIQISDCLKDVVGL